MNIFHSWLLKDCLMWLRIVWWRMPKDCDCSQFLTKNVKENRLHAYSIIHGLLRDIKRKV